MREAISHTVIFHKAVAIKVHIHKLRPFLQQLVPLANFVLQIDDVIMKLFSHLCHLLEFLRHLLVVALKVRQVLLLFVKDSFE